MGNGSKVAVGLGYVAVGVVAFIAGRESLRAELRRGFQEALRPLTELASDTSTRSSFSATTLTEAPAWRVREDASAMDDSSTVTMSLDAAESIRAWPSEVHTPTLVIRCRENQTNVYIVNGTSPNVEYGRDGATVRLRLDSEPAFSRVWSKSTDGEALFSPNAIQFAKQLVNAKTLLYEFTPFNSSPQQTTFNLDGILEHLPKVATACGWKV